MRVANPVRRHPDALLFFTEYLSLTRYFSYQTTKKRAYLTSLTGREVSPLRFNLELKLDSRFSGAGTTSLPLNQIFKYG
jgi:hypothetical protein